MLIFSCRGSSLKRKRPMPVGQIPESWAGRKLSQLTRSQVPKFYFFIYKLRFWDSLRFELTALILPVKLAHCISAESV